MTKILTKRQVTPQPSTSNGHSSHHQNGHHSPSRPGSSFSSSQSKSTSSTASRKRPRNSRSPSPSPSNGRNSHHHHQNGQESVKRERKEYRDRTRRSSSVYHEDRGREKHHDDRRSRGDQYHDDMTMENYFQGGFQDRRGSSSHREDWAWAGSRDYSERC